jgi:hypothetical protein
MREEGEGEEDEEEEDEEEEEHEEEEDGSEEDEGGEDDEEEDEVEAGRLGLDMDKGGGRGESVPRSVEGRTSSTKPSVLTFCTWIKRALLAPARLSWMERDSSRLGRAVTLGSWRGALPDSE